MSAPSDDVHVQERDLWGDEPDYGQPRCICGRFVSDWTVVHPECWEKMRREEEFQLRQSVEGQGLVYR